MDIQKIFGATQLWKQEQCGCSS